jgi:hypothetical protein
MLSSLIFVHVYSAELDLIQSIENSISLHDLEFRLVIKRLKWIKVDIYCVVYATIVLSVARLLNSAIYYDVYAIQLVIYSILAYLSYVPKKNIGQAVGMSEISVQQLPQQGEIHRRSVSAESASAVREVVVKFKDTETWSITSSNNMDPEQLKKLMRLIELQGMAEQEGRLEEFLREQETTPDQDIIMHGMVANLQKHDLRHA